MNGKIPLTLQLIYERMKRPKRLSRRADGHARSLAAPVGSRIPVTPSSIDLNGIRVMLVEDNDDAREFTRRLLARSHVEVTALSSAVEALAAFAVHRPDVMVCDIGMSTMDGYQLIEAIRKLEETSGWVNIPALALTAFSDSSDVRRAGMAGYQRHIGKPFDPDVLIRAVADLSGRGVPRPL